METNDDYPDSDDRKGPIGDMMRKAFSAGLGALFMTEETIRGYLSESKLPRDIAGYVQKNASRGKGDLFSAIAKEVTAILKTIDIPKEAEKFLRNNRINIKAEIDVTPREEGESPFSVKIEKVSAENEPKENKTEKSKRPKKTTD